MRDRFLRFLKTPTSRNIVINTFGTYLNVAFVALFALILFRSMTPEQYGVLSVLLGIAYVLSNILEFGTTATIYSTVPVLYAENEKHLFTFIKSTFFYQSLFSIIIVSALLILFPLLDTVFFKTGASRPILTLTAVSVLLYVWQNFLTNILFAAKRFFRANLYLNISNVVKAGVLLWLALTGTVTVTAVIIIYGFIGPGIYFLLILFKNYTRLPQIRAAEIRREEFRFRYTMTYFAASQFYNLGLRMDLFLLSFFGLGAQVGYYGSAQKIILSIISTTVSISQVLSPQFAEIKSRTDIHQLFKKGLVYMLIPTGIFITLFFTPDALFQLIFTDNFSPAISVTKALALPFILFALGTVPMLFLLYTIKKPIHILWTNILFFLIITIGSYYLIPRLEMFGPPIAVFMALLVTVGLQSVIAWREMRNI